jgi:hypothetical protein
MTTMIQDLTETECAQTDGGLMSLQGVLSTLGGGLCGVPCALIGGAIGSAFDSGFQGAPPIEMSAWHQLTA